MTDRDYADDTTLEPRERQFSITGTKDRERVRIHSEIGSVTRRVCEHPEAHIEERKTESGTTVAVTATLPRACLTIKAASRESANWSQVVSGGVLE